MGGDPTQISFATKQIGSNLCLTVSQSHPPPVDTWTSEDSNKISNRTSPVLSLKCPVSTQVISSIKFASFGTPKGTCGSFSHGRCNSSRSLSLVQKVLFSIFLLSLWFSLPSTFYLYLECESWQACVGSRSCNVEVSTRVFGELCRGVVKSLAVEASCSWVLGSFTCADFIWCDLKYVIVENKANGGFSLFLQSPRH